MLNRKVTRVLSERIDTPDLIATLKHLSTFYTENTLENRRNLRSVLEKQGQSLNQQFIDSFECIVDDFEKVAKSVDGLSKECQHIETILNQTKDATNTLISTTTKLRNQKQEIEKKEKIVNSFLTRFQLSPSEKKIFNQFIYENIITFELFNVFEKMMIIRNDCKKLLNNYHQRASLDIMDRFAKQLESGYEKLYRSVQKSARKLGIDVNKLIHQQSQSQFSTTSTSDNDDDNNTDNNNNNNNNNIDLELFGHCLYQLRQRSGYFEHCCQELSSARRLYWVQRFINALTRGEPKTTNSTTTTITSNSGNISPNIDNDDNNNNNNNIKGTIMSRPIEMYAYDPVRYLNDMLTWIHNALTQERQFALFIFKIPPRLVKKQLLKEDDFTIEDDGIINEYKEYSKERIIGYLDRVLEGLFRPLSMRILSILNNNKSSGGIGTNTSSTDFYYDVVTAYRLCHVLDFYVITINQLFQFTDLKKNNHDKYNLESIIIKKEEEEERKDDNNVANKIQLKFINSLQDLRRTSYNKFYKMVQHRMDKFLDSGIGGNKNSSSSTIIGINISSDLSPNNIFKDHLERLNDIMSIYSTNLVPNNVKIDDFTSVLNSFIDPMLQVVNKSIDNLTDTEKCVYLINILIIILNTLKNQPFAKHSARFETLSLLIETQKEKLIEYESSFILKDCGVFTVLFTLKQYKQNQRPNDINKLCDIQGLDESSMKLAMKSLSAYIFSLGALSMPKIEKITDLEIRQMTRNGVADVIFSAYKLLWDNLSNKDNGYKNVQQELTHSPSQVRQVLQLN